MYRSSPPDDYRSSPDNDERVEVKDSAAKYEQERIQVLQQERVHVQKKTFTKWCNSFLEKVGLVSSFILSATSLKVKVKVWVLVIALLTRLEQQRFTISEEATDWHELMIPWRIMRPSIARDGKQLDLRCSTQTPPPQSAH